MNEITTKQRVLAAAAHIGFILGGIGFLLLPFAIRTIWSDDEFIAAHARQALRIQLAAVAVSLLAIAAAMIVSPFAATIAGIALLTIGWVFHALLGAIRAMTGELFTYPALKLLHIS